MVVLEHVLRAEPLWDEFAVLAILLDTMRPEAVWINCNEFYGYRGFDPSRDPQSQIDAEEQALDAPDIGSILILTEGKTDQRIISSAMNAMYPEYAFSYEYMDFEGFRIEGGASPLAKMVKGFAGIRAGTRMVAIFDNDAAGHEALQTLSSIELPTNIRLLTLPDVELARAYPTWGPGGRAMMDVNGSACAIEMFLGRGALTVQGDLRRIRWSQWNARAERYQGEMEGKAEAGQAFLHLISQGHPPEALRQKLPEMDRLMLVIFEAFAE